jgi:hypothetical protein
MNSIKSVDLGRKKKNASKRIFKTSFTLLLIVFAFTMSSPSSFFQILKPAMAAGSLTSVTVIPTNNIVNTRTTYDIFFKTATTGTIKIINMTFPSGFDVSAATKLIERSGIGSGSLSAPSSTTLIYSVSNPVSVPAGTTIRLEIGRIVNSIIAGNFRVSIATENTTPIIIDGPTNSFSFPIKAIGTGDIADNSITGNDVSPDFMIRKSLHDDIAGHAHGWNPDASTTAYAISDSDILGTSNSEFVSVMVRSGNPAFCAAASADAGLFGVYCNSAPGNNAELDYIITKLPAHVITDTTVSSTASSITSSSSSPFASSKDLESIATHDEISSEFP